MGRSLVSYRKSQYVGARIPVCLKGEAVKCLYSRLHVARRIPCNRN